jgi:hypothetical protein
VLLFHFNKVTLLYDFILLHYIQKFNLLPFTTIDPIFRKYRVHTVIFSLAILYLQRYVKNVFKNLLLKKSELLSEIYIFTEICKLDLQLPVQSVPITTKIVSLNPSHGDVYSIQLLCDKVC